MWNLLDALQWDVLSAVAGGILWGLVLEGTVLLLRWALRSVHLMITGVATSEVME